MTATADPSVETVAPAEWPRAQRRMVLGLAGLTIVAEIASLLVDAGPNIGTIPMSLSLVPSLLVLLALGPRSNGRVVDAGRLVPFWLGVGGIYLFGWALWARDDQAFSVAGLAVAAVNEEVVYRFAVPLVLTTVLLLMRVPTSVARVTGYVVAGVWWVLLPGHRAQTDTVMMLLTFVVFAAVSAIVVARSRALLPMALAHGALNIITLAQLRGDIDPGLRGVLAACLVFLLVGTFAWPGDDDARTRRRDAAADGTIDDLVGDVVGDVVIDLRDGRRPSVIRGDQVTWLDVAVGDQVDIEETGRDEVGVAPSAPVMPSAPVASSDGVTSAAPVGSSAGVTSGVEAEAIDGPATAPSSAPPPSAPPSSPA